MSSMLVCDDLGNWTVCLLFGHFAYTTLRLKNISSTGQFAYCLDILPTYSLECVVTYTLKCIKISVKIVLSSY